MRLRVLLVSKSGITAGFVTSTVLSQLRCVWLKHFCSIPCINRDVVQPLLLRPHSFHSRFAVGGWGVFAGFRAYLKCTVTTGFATTMTFFHLSYDWLGYYLMWCTWGFETTVVSVMLRMARVRFWGSVRFIRGFRVTYLLISATRRVARVHLGSNTCTM